MKMIKIQSPASQAPLVVLADRRWPLTSGIGVVQTELEARRPDGVEIEDIGVKGSIGSPFSPLRISMALSKYRRLRDNIFVSWGFVPPLWSTRKSLIIVHDLTHLHYYGWLKRLYYNIVFKQLYKNCSQIVCVSEFTRREFLRWSGIDSRRVHVMYNGCSEIFTPDGDRLNLGFRFLLYPGNHRSYKNLDRLIRAYKLSEVSQGDIHLVLTGREQPALRALIDELGLSEFVHFAGILAHEDIPKLYRAAEAVVFVSLYEGFGLPIVEAMAAGVPVITSNVTSMPEVAGDAALLVDPSSESEISAAIRKVVSDEALRNSLVRAGLVRIKTFSWDKSAAQFWSLASQLNLQ